MGMNLEDISQRVAVEGKDSLNQHQLQIGDFISDITREITSTFRFPWLIFEDTVATTGDWVDLDKEVRSVLGADVDSAPINAITEESYFFNKPKIATSSKTYYRLRWNRQKRKYQINFVNVTAGVTVNILVRHVYNDPSHLPDEFEEAVTEGAIYKYLMFLEGDDTQVAQQHKDRYTELVQQHYHLLDMELTDENDDRVLTNDEIEYMRSNNYEQED